MTPFRRLLVVVLLAVGVLGQSGQLVENIITSIAEFYSANLGEETKKGMRMAVQRGSWPYFPLPPPPCRRRRGQPHRGSEQNRNATVDPGSGTPRTAA